MRLTIPFVRLTIEPPKVSKLKRSVDKQGGKVVMTGVRARGEDVRKFILQNVEKHPGDIAKVASEHFSITRQAISKHLQRLVSEQAITESGKTRNRAYQLATLSQWLKQYKLGPELTEDRVWREDVQAVLGAMPDNVIAIWQHGFTEIFNNALDHADARTIAVRLKKTAVDTEMLIADDGVGIFRKIQKAHNLLDERHAVLELSKGKLTTDPKNHSGEGIFFTTRMFDEFCILSGGVYFGHKIGRTHDYALDTSNDPVDGTTVVMTLNNHTSRTVRKVFDTYAEPEDAGFTKTVVPVDLARYGNENLVSRSQAKRVLARVEKFKRVIFDFVDVPTIGQAFADEIFRVFAERYPGIELIPVKYNAEVKKMIDRALAHETQDEPSRS